MSRIPTKVTEKQFNTFIEPCLSIAKRGYESSIPLVQIFNGILHKLYTGCQWKELPTEKFPDPKTGKILSWQAFYHHYRKWCRDGSLLRLFQFSILAVSHRLNFSELNLDGTHSIAKKGGEEVAYQRRKKAKTSNMLPVVDAGGYIVGFLPLTAGNHHDSYKLKERLSDLFKSMNQLGLPFHGAYFNADAAFDTRTARKVCFNFGVIPNICRNKRNQQKKQRGRKRLFDPEIYKDRFVSERLNAWVDKFRSLLIRFEVKAIYRLGANLIAFALITIRDLI